MTFTTLALGETPKELIPVVPIASKPITQMTIEELKAEIARIMTLIAQLQKELLRQQTTAVFEGIPSDFKFKLTLKSGDTGSEVKYLQIILKKEIGEPTYPDDVPATGKFGAITRASVIKFQEKYASEILTPLGLTKGTGLAAGKTREKLNQLLNR